MNNKLYVGNLPFSAQEDDLSKIFSEAGTVESVKIITDPYSGRSKGFAFIEMESEEAASKAVEAINGKEMEGRNIKVDVARAKENRPRPGGGGGGGCGGRGGGGGGGGGGGRRW